MRTLNNIFKISKNTLTQERGSVLIVAVLILMLLTLIGISATKTTDIEIRISGNDKFHKMAFHNADTGVYSIPKVISTALNTKQTPPFPDSTNNLVQYADGTATDPDFFEELVGIDPYDTTADISFNNDNASPIQIDVQRLKSVTIAGGGAEFASGVDGSATSQKGIYYGLDSFGSGPANSQSNIGARYLKVLGAAGGM